MSSDTVATPDWSKVQLSDEYTWVDARSKNGNLYKIGTPKSAPQSDPEESVSDEGGQFAGLADSKTPFSINVNWQPTGTPSGQFDGHSNTSAPEKSTTGITAYILKKGSLNYNELSIDTTADYDYFFTDNTDDEYEINVIWIRSGTYHSVSYFSSNPAIKKVRGK